SVPGTPAPLSPVRSAPPVPPPSEARKAIPAGWYPLPSALVEKSPFVTSQKIQHRLNMDRRRQRQRGRVCGKGGTVDGVGESLLLISHADKVVAAGRGIAEIAKVVCAQRGLRQQPHVLTAQDLPCGTLEKRCHSRVIAAAGVAFKNGDLRFHSH